MFCWGLLVGIWIGAIIGVFAFSLYASSSDTFYRENLELRKQVEDLEARLRYLKTIEEKYNKLLGRW